MPLVSILMPVFNSEKTVEDAISSIINQSFKDWKMYIVDDFSSDSTYEKIQKYKYDKRIKILRNKTQLGLTKSLNKLLTQKKDCKYIARMDADDISSENRLFVQINFLEKNNHVDVVGSNVEYYDRSNNFLSYSKLPLKHKEISKNLIKKNVIIHSTTIFREKFINQLNGYRDFFYNAQDYDLWLRGRNKFIYENLNERLLKHKLDKRKKITNELYDVYAKILNFKFDKNILTSISWIIISISLIIVKRFNYKSKIFRN